MSPKKQPAPPGSAVPKDDLIDALLGNDSERDAAPSAPAKPPPPPNEAEKKAAAVSPKLQKLEDVLKKLKPSISAPAPASAKVAADEDKTVALEEPSRGPTLALVEPEPPSPAWQEAKTEILAPATRTTGPEADRDVEQFMPTEIRPNSPGARFREEARQAQPGAAIFSSAEAALRQSENLRVAQKRISDLENELERVRRENENLRSASETLRRRMDELQAQSENAEVNTQEVKKIADEERKVLRGQLSNRDREMAELRARIDDAEGRLEANFRKIRVRERDLEHRIEIIKAESQSIAANKDRMILDLKRQIDQLSAELNHAKSHAQETFNQFKERQEIARRAVRALRIALTVLEGEEDSGSRKAE